MATTLRTVFLGPRIPYRIGLELQEALVRRRIAALSSPNPLNEDVLLLLEHTPVYTAGRRETDHRQHELEADRLKAFGADYVPVQRGGQTTYHGPGQLVGYPIVDLNAWQMPTRRFVDLLQSSLKSVAERDLGIPTIESDNTGVFTSSTTKVASIGLQLQHRVTMHGFALNVEDQVKPFFANIVACGLADVKATTVESERRERDLRPSMSVQDVAELVQTELSNAWDRQIVPLEHDGPIWDIVHDAIRRSERGQDGNNTPP